MLRGMVAVVVLATACASASVALRREDLCRPDESRAADFLALADREWHDWSTEQSESAQAIAQLDHLADLDREFDRQWREARESAELDDGTWGVESRDLVRFLVLNGALRCP